jgi:hypothetical protein
MFMDIHLYCDKTHKQFEIYIVKAFRKEMGKKGGAMTQCRIAEAHNTSKLGPIESEYITPARE